MDTPMLANKQNLAFNGSEQTLVGFFVGYLMPKLSLLKNSGGTN